MQYVSLGCNCQVSHQIRRVHGQQGSRVFDWVVTNSRALDRWLRSDLRNLFERVTLSSNGKYVSDYYTGLQFYPHDLPSEMNRISPDWQDALPEVKEKYLRRSARTRELLASGDPLVLVRRVIDAGEAANEARHTELSEALQATFPKAQFRLVLVGEQATPLDGKVYQIDRAPTWHGDDYTWNTALAEIGDIQAWQRDRVIRDAVSEMGGPD